RSRGRDRRRLPRLFTDDLRRRTAEARPGRRLQAGGRNLEGDELARLFPETSAAFCDNGARTLPRPRVRPLPEVVDDLVHLGGNGRVRGSRRGLACSAFFFFASRRRRRVERSGFLQGAARRDSARRRTWPIAAER